ncbi:VOC family protein [Fredinandcohnia sp. 179-A 10B2 NHS]|uniref:VOC family protein n=1 Tax=Fredinandcohnia sp. 179-A 10B2 NHS TaxID=3235176 RepID=UPI00399F6348
MFVKLECVCIHTKDIQASLDFYKNMGLTVHWQIDRELESGVVWKLVGLRFPSNESSELVLSNHPELSFTEVEILVEDVRETYKTLSENNKVNWIKTPFATESGHVAVMEAPDKNVFVLVGK